MQVLSTVYCLSNILCYLSIIPMLLSAHTIVSKVLIGLIIGEIPSFATNFEFKIPKSQSISPYRWMKHYYSDFNYLYVY